MALRWIDGFERYGTTNGNAPTGIATGAYTSSLGSFTIRAGRISGHSVQLSASANLLTTPAFTANDTWIVGLAFRYELVTLGALSTEQDILAFQDGANVQNSISITPGGEIKVYRGDRFSLLGTSSGAKLRAGCWNYIEVKIKINTTTGTVDVHVNGVSVLSLSSVNTDRQATSQATKIQLRASSTTADAWKFDDLYICDKSGSNNNTFLGPQKVTVIFPTGDHGTNQWTPTGTGTTHADRVKENPHDSSTTYVSDTVSGDTEEWDYANTGSEISSIKGAQVNTAMETDSATAFSVKNHINSGGTSSDDTGTAGTNGTYNFCAFLAETDPNTSALWTKTNLDAALFGVKLV